MTHKFGIRLVTLLPVAFTSLLLPTLARVRRGILFGVTVPLDFAAGPVARRVVRRFRIGVSILAVIVLAAMLLILQFVPVNSLLTLTALVAAVPVELILTFVLWQRASNHIRPYAAMIPLERNADLVPSSATAPLIAIACAAVPLAAMAIYLHTRWSRIPTRWAVHFDIHGVANGWATRTFAASFSS
jgi:uncharacterized membrane protein